MSPIASASAAGLNQTAPSERIVLGEKTFWSRMSFSYINNLIRAGYSHPLEENELPDLPRGDSACLHGEKLEECWNQLKREAASHVPPANANVEPVWPLFVPRAVSIAD